MQLSEPMTFEATATVTVTVTATTTATKNLHKPNRKQKTDKRKKLNILLISGGNLRNAANQRQFQIRVHECISEYEHEYETLNMNMIMNPNMNGKQNWFLTG